MNGKSRFKFYVVCGLLSRKSQLVLLNRSSGNVAMRKLFELFKLGRTTSEAIKGFYCVPRRGLRYQETVKWVRPPELPFYHPSRSGDLVPMPPVNSNVPYLPFTDSKELETADAKVKKVFSVGYQIHKHSLEMYQHELVQKVKNNSFDTDSKEVKIAKLTARIRYNQIIINKRPAKQGSLRIKTKLLIDKRFKLLRILRQEDYKKFEWLLETLDLEYRPPPVPDSLVTRKKSLMLLTKLKVEQYKEEKLAELKKSFDEQKIPFLENKISQLKEIKEKEEKYNLQVTVTDADIEECIQKLEKVKVEVAERAKRGYKRKIHPYFLEPYDENILREKEKEGEEIREEQERKAMENNKIKSEKI